MSTRLLIATFALAASAAFAQPATTPAAPAASGPAMQMHDHAAVKGGAPMAKSHMDTASGAKKAKKRVKPHDHSKEKNT